MGGGCATHDFRGRPSQVGELTPPQVKDGLELRLRHRDGTSFALGGRIRFEVDVRNAGTRVVSVPLEPVITLVWVYPSGRRDNMMRPYSAREALDGASIRFLAPGESMTLSVDLSTRFFERAGIMEFAAILHVPPVLGAVPEVSSVGRYISNRIGLEARRL
jgi:hypothetical protein